MLVSFSPCRQDLIERRTVGRHESVEKNASRAAKDCRSGRLPVLRSIYRPLHPLLSWDCRVSMISSSMNSRGLETRRDGVMFSYPPAEGLELLHGVFGIDSESSMRSPGPSPLYPLHEMGCACSIWFLECCVNTRGRWMTPWWQVIARESLYSPPSRSATTPILLLRLGIFNDPVRRSGQYVRGSPLPAQFS